MSDTHIDSPVDESEDAPTVDTAVEVPEATGPGADIEAQIREIFEARGEVPGDDVDDHGAGTVESAAAPEVDVAAADDTPVDDGVEPEPTVDPPVAGVDLGSIIDELGIAPDEATEVLRWVKGLSPDQIDAVNAAVLRTSQPSTPEGVPGDSAASGHGAPAPTPPPGAGAVPPPVGQAGMPQLPDLGVLAEVVPGLGDYLSGLQSEVVAARQQQASLAQAEADRRLEQTRKQVDAGIDEFRDQNPAITDDLFRRVQRRASELQIMPGLVSKHAGDAKAAAVEAFSTAMWSDPDIQGVLVQQRIDEYASSQATTSERKARAAAVNGSGGSVARMSPQAAPADMTPQQRTEQIAAALAAAMEQGS